ncbi:MAG: glycosyltransferase family 2 protein [Thermoplasmatales archaeon]
MVRPRISVIITAHNRRSYLLDALNSVINQTIDRKLYEVIIVKNFKDEAIEQLIERNGIISIFSDTEFLGIDKTLGVKASNGDIISFLDDDDKFLPNKLETVLQFFDAYQDLVYYRNNPLFFDQNGERERVISGAFRVRNFLNPNYGQLKTLLEERAAFNSSCISIRKSLIEEKLQEFAKIKNVVDYYMFILACNSGYRIITDVAELTQYRISGKMSTSRPTGTFAEFKVKTLRVKRNELEDLQLIQSFPSRQEVARAIACEVIFLRLHVDLLSDIAGRETILMDGLKYIHCMLSIPSKYKPFFLAYALFATLNANFVQKIIYRSSLGF